MRTTIFALAALAEMTATYYLTWLPIYGRRKADLRWLHAIEALADRMNLPK